MSQRVEGADRRAPVLFLHGFPDVAATFRHQRAAAEAAGRRTAAPTMRGYAPDRVPADGRYDQSALIADALGALDALAGPDGRAHLVGHDWGAVVAWGLAGAAPERLVSVAGLAVPHLARSRSALLRHPVQIARSSYMLLFQLPWIAEAAAPRMIRPLWARWSPGWTAPEDHLSAVERAFAQPGVVPAALGYYRAFLRSPVAWTSAARPIRIPAMAMTGAQDGCMGTGYFEASLDPACFSAGLRLERVEGAGHFLHLERPEYVSELLLGFWDSAER